MGSVPSSLSTMIDNVAYNNANRYHMNMQAREAGYNPDSGMQAGDLHQTDSTKAANGQTVIDTLDWDEQRDFVYMRVLSAEEFLNQMNETAKTIELYRTSRDSERHLEKIKGCVGLRGHLLDELLRIEAMLAEDDPQLLCLIPFERSYSKVVLMIRELRDQATLIDEGEISLLTVNDSSSQADLSFVTTATDLDTAVTTTYAKKRSSLRKASKGGASRGGVEVNQPMMLQNRNSGTATLANDFLFTDSAENLTNLSEDELKKRHKEEEEMMAERYAKKLLNRGRDLSLEEVNRLLSRHLLHVQALRKRQREELERLRAKKEREVKEKRKYTDQAGEAFVEPELQAALGDSLWNSVKDREDDFTEEDLNKLISSYRPSESEKRASKNGLDESEEPSSASSQLQAAKGDSLWNSVKDCEDDFTEEDLNKLISSYSENGKKSSKNGLDESEETSSASSQKRDQFVQIVLKRSKMLSDEDFSRLLRNYLSDADNFRDKMKTDKDRLNDKLRQRLSKHQKDGGENGIQYCEDDISATEAMIKAIDRKFELDLVKKRRNLSAVEMDELLSTHQRRRQTLINEQRKRQEETEEALKKRLASIKKKSEVTVVNPMTEDNGELVEQHYPKSKKELRGQLKKEASSDVSLASMNEAASNIIKESLKSANQLHEMRQKERERLDQRLKRSLQDKPKESK